MSANMLCIVYKFLTFDDYDIKVERKSLVAAAAAAYDHMWSYLMAQGYK